MEKKENILDDSQELVDYYIDTCKKNGITMYLDNFTEWILAMKHVLDGGEKRRTVEEVKNVIDFIPSHHWYKGNLRHPHSFQYYYAYVVRSMNRIEKRNLS